MNWLKANTSSTPSMVWDTLRELELSLSTAAQDLIVQLEQTDPALAKTDSRKTLELLVLAPTEPPMPYDKRQEPRWRALRQHHGLQHLQQVCQDARLWPLLAAWWQHYGLPHDAPLPLTPTELAIELPVDLLIEHSNEVPQWMLWLTAQEPQHLNVQWFQLLDQLVPQVQTFLLHTQDFLAWLKSFRLVPFWHTVSPEQTGKTQEQILFAWIAENPLERFPAFYQRLQVFSKPELRTFIGIARLCEAWQSDWLDVLAPYADTWQYWQTALQQLDAPSTLRPEHSLTALPKAFERAMRQEIQALPEFIRLTEQPDFVRWHDGLRRSDGPQRLIYDTFSFAMIHDIRWSTLEKDLQARQALSLQAGVWYQRYEHSAPRLNATVKWKRAWEIDQAYTALDTLNQAWSEVSLGQEAPWQPWMKRLLQHLTDLATQPWSRLKDILPTAAQLSSLQDQWHQALQTQQQRYQQLCADRQRWQAHYTTQFKRQLASLEELRHIADTLYAACAQATESTPLEDWAQALTDYIQEYQLLQRYETLFCTPSHHSANLQLPECLHEHLQPWQEAIAQWRQHHTERRNAVEQGQEDHSTLEWHLWQHRDTQLRHWAPLFQNFFTYHDPYRYLDAEHQAQLPYNLQDWAQQLSNLWCPWQTKLLSSDPTHTPSLAAVQAWLEEQQRALQTLEAVRAVYQEKQQAKLRKMQCEEQERQHNLHVSIQRMQDEQNTTTNDLATTKKELKKSKLENTQRNITEELSDVERRGYRKQFGAILKPIFEAQPAHWVLLQTPEELETWNNLWEACGRLHVLWWGLHQQLLRHPQLLCQVLLTTERLNGLSDSLATSQLGDEDQQTLKQAILPTDMTQTALTWANSRWQTVDHQLQGFLSAPSPDSATSPTEANATPNTSQALESLSHTLAHLPWTLWADSLADWLYELREAIQKASFTTAELPENTARRQLTP